MKIINNKRIIDVDCISYNQETLFLGYASDINSVELHFIIEPELLKQIENNFTYQIVFDRSTIGETVKDEIAWSATDGLTYVIPPAITHFSNDDAVQGHQGYLQLFVMQGGEEGSSMATLVASSQKIPYIIADSLNLSATTVEDLGNTLWNSVRQAVNKIQSLHFDTVNLTDNDSYIPSSKLMQQLLAYKANKLTVHHLAQAYNYKETQSKQYIHGDRPDVYEDDAVKTDTYYLYINEFNRIIGFMICASVNDEPDGYPITQIKVLNDGKIEYRTGSKKVNGEREWSEWTGLTAFLHSAYAYEYIEQDNKRYFHSNLPDVYINDAVKPDTYYLYVNNYRRVVGFMICASVADEVDGWSVIQIKVLYNSPMSYRIGSKKVNGEREWSEWINYVTLESVTEFFNGYASPQNRLDKYFVKTCIDKSKVKLTANTRILGFGDSIMERRKFSNNLSVSWLDLIQERTGCLAPINRAVGNTRFDGDDSPTQPTFAKQLSDFHTAVENNTLADTTGKIVNISEINLIIIAGGTNDVGYNRSISNFKTAVGTFFDGIKSEFASRGLDCPPVLVITPIRRGTEADINEYSLDNIEVKIAKYSAVLNNLALQSGFSVLNGYDIPILVDDMNIEVGQNTAEIQSFMVPKVEDPFCIHPNLIGLNIYAQAVINAIQLPTKVSDLINDSGYLTQQDISDKATVETVTMLGDSSADNHIDNAKDNGKIYRVIEAVSDTSTDYGWMVVCGDRTHRGNNIGQIRCLKDGTIAYRYGSTRKSGSEYITTWSGWYPFYIYNVEQTNNKVNTISTFEPSDVKYPSEKAVRTALNSLNTYVDSKLSEKSPYPPTISSPSESDAFPKGQMFYYMGETYIKTKQSGSSGYDSFVFSDSLTHGLSLKEDKFRYNQRPPYRAPVTEQNKSIWVWGECVFILLDNGSSGVADHPIWIRIGQRTVYKNSVPTTQETNCSYVPGYYAGDKWVRFANIDEGEQESALEQKVYICTRVSCEKNDDDTWNYTYTWKPFPIGADSIASYGITDAYTKAEINAMIGDVGTALDTLNENLSEV